MSRRMALYDEKMGVLIREQKTPRIALFSFEDVADCPASKDVPTKGRITEVAYVEGKGMVMQDSWEMIMGSKLLEENGREERSFWQEGRKEKTSQRWKKRFKLSLQHDSTL